ncbi:DUF2909 family protein [Halomonas sp. YLGW01]|uniref:DUF2909 family protein n=1 Tax=Halomonas sp. YLGW01 TaxID=2773308 RepID=UPI001784B63A|nr:DUF2909 family protein [Halomonas sp. YLGW01]
MLKALITLVFVCMVASLVAGAGFLLRDQGRSRRLLISLKVRVSLATLLLALLAYGFYFGGLSGT